MWVKSHVSAYKRAPDLSERYVQPRPQTNHQPHKAYLWHKKCLIYRPIEQNIQALDFNHHLFSLTTDLELC